MSSKRIYLAGPDVFLRDPLAVAAAKREICSDFGFAGIFPLENALDLNGLDAEEAGHRISRSNEELMRSCDLIIANMTPFRSPSADVGTAFEMGFMRALGRPVFAYSNVAGSFTERTQRFIEDTGGGVRKREDGSLEDSDGMEIEGFDLTDNLMLDGAVLSSGARIVVRRDVPPGERFTDLRAFVECVELAAQLTWD